MAELEELRRLRRQVRHRWFDACWHSIRAIVWKSSEMQYLETVAISPAASQWLNTADSAQVMHVFEKALNLVDARGSVLSLVTTSIGPGPFSVVVSRPEGGATDEFDFGSLVDVESVVNATGGSLSVGSLYLQTSGAEIWQPWPDWARLAPLSLNRQTDLLWRLLDESAPPDSMAALLLGRSSEAYHQRAYGAWADLAQGLKSGKAELSKRGARAMAGLGPGLTPAGDDFLIGIIYAIHCSPGSGGLHHLVEIIRDTAIPRTTRLSAAWLEAGARGEASCGWHSLVDAMVAGREREVEAAAYQILPTGHTSGADALAGFLAARNILSRN